MKPTHKPERAWLALPLLLAIATSAVPLLPLLEKSLVVAQTPAKNPESVFPLPASVAADTKVTIDGSPSMKTINETLKADFEKTYTGTEVILGDKGTDQALADLKAGTLDVAAIGRPLNAQEKAAGLVPVPISRHKIAIIVGAENPFDKSITFEQFAQIFRGEITDWSKLGGAPGKIRFIDRVEESDTRKAFAEYDVFQTKPFKTGDNAEVVEDQTAAVAAALGKDGIGYAIVDQVDKDATVKILKMHDTLPDDQRYPFSQPLYYIYKNPPSEAVKAFLGFAADPGQAAQIEEARQAAVEATPTPTPEAVATPTPTATPVAPETTGSFPWWIFLLPILAIPFFFLNRREPEVVTEAVSTAAPPPPPPPPRPIAPSRLILTPRNCRDAYAYWEVPEERKLELRGQGGRQLTLRLYEATGNSEPIFVSQIDCPELEQDQHIAIPVDDRNYLVELGYQTPEQAWLPIARSEVVHVPACPVTPAIVESLPPEANRIILTPRNCRQAYAYWEITPELQESLRLQGGQDLRLKVYEVDHPENAALYECSELDSDRQVPIPVDARDYIAELGYLTATGNWLSLARSLPVPVPPCVDEEIPTPGLLEETGELLSGLGVGAMGVVGAAGAAFGEVFNFAPAGSEAQITLTPQDSEQGLVTWDIPEALKVEARTLGGERLALRIYDLSDSNNNERPDSVREYDCAEFEQHKEVRFYAGDRYYAAELGYISREGRWLPLARSASVWIPNPETQPS